jgi:hypothetical protein
MWSPVPYLQGCAPVQPDFVRNIFCRDKVALVFCRPCWTEERVVGRTILGLHNGWRSVDLYQWPCTYLMRGLLSIPYLVAGACTIIDSQSPNLSKSWQAGQRLKGGGGGVVGDVAILWCERVVWPHPPTPLMWQVHTVISHRVYHGEAELELTLL